MCMDDQKTTPTSPGHSHLHGIICCLSVLSIHQFSHPVSVLPVKASLLFFPTIPTFCHWLFLNLIFLSNIYHLTMQVNTDQSDAEESRPARPGILFSSLQTSPPAILFYLNDWTVSSTVCLMGSIEFCFFKFIIYSVYVGSRHSATGRHPMLFCYYSD